MKKAMDAQGQPVDDATLDGIDRGDGAVRLSQIAGARRGHHGGPGRRQVAHLRVGGSAADWFASSAVASTRYGFQPVRPRRDRLAGARGAAFARSICRQGRRRTKLVCTIGPASRDRTAELVAAA